MLDPIRSQGMSDLRVWHLRFDDQPLPKTQADVMKRWARAKYRTFWHSRVREEVLCSGGPPPSPLLYAAVRGERHSSSRPDRINVWYSFKAIVDGLNLHVILDDNPGVIIHEDYQWVKAPPKNGFVTLDVYELRGPEDRVPWLPYAQAEVSPPIPPNPAQG